MLAKHNPLTWSLHTVFDVNVLVLWCLSVFKVIGVMPGSVAHFSYDNMDG